jgi:hypothetical protein
MGSLKSDLIVLVKFSPMQLTLSTKKLQTFLAFCRRKVAKIAKNGPNRPKGPK